MVCAGLNVALLVLVLTQSPSSAPPSEPTVDARERRPSKFIPREREAEPMDITDTVDSADRMVSDDEIDDTSDLLDM